MAFLSIYPNTKGFTVVIPKDHYGSDVLFDLPEEILIKFINFTKRVIKILLEHFADVGRVGLIIEGTGIDHAHIKLFPMHGTEHFKQGIWKQHLSNMDKFFTTYEGYISSHDGPRADFKELKQLAKELRKTAKNA